MPTFRDYPEATSVLQTDAFLIDRVGTGTMYVEEGVINTNTAPISLSVFDTGASDKTAAFNAAFAYLTSLGGGVLYVPPGNWPCNIILLNSNIVITGNAGNIDTYLSSLSPYDITKPCVTFGDGSTNVQFSGLNNIAIDGSDKSVNGRTHVANNCPQGLLLKGGTAFCTFDRIQFYNGNICLDLEPSVTAAVSSNYFTRLFIRNDITDSATAACIKSTRLADPGFNTANFFSNIKTNNGAGFIGYALYLNGSGAELTFHMSDSYLDVQPSHGVYINSAQWWGWDNQVDPGALNQTVITVNGSIASYADIARVLVGAINISNQNVTFTTGPTTIAIKDESMTYAYRARLMEALFCNGGSAVMRFTPATDPGDAGNIYPYIDLVGGLGPIRINRSNLRVMGDFEFYGTNTTGAGTASLSTNCPAATPGAPYTWIEAKSSDGSTVYIPVWK